MGIDSEKAFCMAHYHDKEFRMACMDVFARGTESWEERVHNLRQYVERKHMLVESLGMFAGVVIYPKSTTRKQPACIVVRSTQAHHIDGAYLLDHTGVCCIQYVEKGRVRVGEPSKDTEVWGAAEDTALCA